MRATGARYLVGTPTSMLKTLEQHGVDQNWEAGQPGVDVTRCRSPEGTEEPVVLCRAAGRKEKANAIRNRFVIRLDHTLVNLAEQAATGRARDQQKVERQIGRLVARHRRAAALVTVTVNEVGCGQDARLSLTINKNEARDQGALETGGHDILRTNWTERDPKTVWNPDLQRTEGEDRFRIEQHDVGMRPIFHHTQDRTHAHILVCVLALTRWRPLPQWMNASGLGTAPRKLVEEMRALKSLDGLLPTRETTIRLRMGATAPKELTVLLQRMKILLPNTPKVLEHVVTKMA